MPDITHDYQTVMPRAQVGREAEQNKLEPLGYAWFVILVCAIGMAAACIAEMYSLTIALGIQWPTTSDGTDLGHDMMSIRYGIGVALLLCHVALRRSADDTDRPIGRLMRTFRVVPTVALLGGMAVFMFATTAAVTGGDDGQTGLAGMAIGIGCSALFTISFLASNALAGKFLSALRAILSGRAQRAKIADIDCHLKGADDCRAHITALRREIEAREQPDMLRQKVAADAAAIVGPIAAAAYDRWASAEAASADRRPEDEWALEDTPLPALDRLQAYLKGLTTEYFFNLLKKEA